jgi:hypothetical protein
MSTNVYTPRELLGGGGPIAPADEQRLYVWDEQQLEELWVGLSNAAGEGGGAFLTYFLGSILLRPPTTGPRWFVVDGWQRLISIVVLLCVFRDYFSGAGEAQYEGVASSLLTTRSYRGGDSHPVLVVAPADQPAFLACVRVGAPVPGHRIMKAREFFRAKLSTAVSVNRIFEALVERTKVVAVVADERTLSSLYSLEPARFRDMIERDESARDVIAVAGRRAAHRRIRMLLHDDEYFDLETQRTPDGKAETVWQRFFEDNPWILGVSLAGQLLTSWDDERLEQVVAGFSVAGAGKRTDALLQTTGRVRSLVLAEFKTHRTPLLGGEYRPGCWSPSGDLAGGVAQSQGTAYRAVDQIGERLFRRSDDGSELTSEGGTYLIRPRSFLVIGQLAELLGIHGGIHPDKMRSFELYRRSTTEPDILTFDELLARAEWLVSPERRLDSGTCARQRQASSTVSTGSGHLRTGGLRQID